MMTFVENRDKECRTAEDRFQKSQEKLLQLKENEEILTKRIQMMQIELVEFQKALLKSHNVPIDGSGLPTISSEDRFCVGARVDILGYNERVHLVKELLLQVNRSHDQVDALKAKLNEERRKRESTESTIAKLKTENKEWKSRNRHLESLTFEV